MRRAENIAIGVFMVIMVGLCLTLVILTNQLKNKVCDCYSYPPSTTSEKIIEQALHENESKIDSLHADSLNSVNDAVRNLQRRYRSGP